MKVAVTGVTGCVRRYVVRHRARAGHRLRCWCRPGSDRGGFEDVAGPSLNGHDRYVSEEQGARIAKELRVCTRAVSELHRGPKSQTETAKLRTLAIIRS